MKHYGMVEQKAVVAKTCDGCGFFCDDTSLLAEWLSYSDTAGYVANEFRDGDTLELDLCESCKKRILGDYIKVTPPWDEGEWLVVDSVDKSEIGTFVTLDKGP